jgi:hypothetical protein
VGPLIRVPPPGVLSTPLGRFELQPIVRAPAGPAGAGGPFGNDPFHSQARTGGEQVSGAAVEHRDGLPAAPAKRQSFQQRSPLSVGLTAGVTVEPQHVERHQTQGRAPVCGQPRRHRVEVTRAAGADDKVPVQDHFVPAEHVG